jgi:anti-sigma-K factor RsiG
LAVSERRIDRILDPGFLLGLEDLTLEQLRARRDDCMAEREYLSFLRRLVQGRVEIMQAEREARAGEGDVAAVVDRLPEILGVDDGGNTGRGEAVRIGLPDEELTTARRRVERLVADAGVSDPTSLDDDALARAMERFAEEESGLSMSRRAVIEVLDRVLDELKRRYKDDPSLALT